MAEGARTWRVEEVPVERILDLRWAVLRPGRARETASFGGDSDEGTHHFALIEGGEEEVGTSATPLTCLTLLASTWDGQPAWQLRGMATAGGQQGRGWGRRLLAGVSAWILDQPAERAPRILWCNARSSAIPFYEACGWRVASAPFEIEGIGSHVRMVLVLNERR